MLYIFRFLHQTTTLQENEKESKCCISFVSYIKPQLHAGTTRLSLCCISFVSYIKPQHYKFRNNLHSVVYLSFPTSNHNMVLRTIGTHVLYIFRFLHQTTTVSPLRKVISPLYIFRFLHQTTTSLLRVTNRLSCISFVSYIKPQLTSMLILLFWVVYLSFPTSNHNCRLSKSCQTYVVYLSFPTSNHNSV